MADAASLINDRTKLSATAFANAVSFLQQLQDVADVNFGDKFNVDQILPKRYVINAVSPALASAVPVGSAPDITVSAQAPLSQFSENIESVTPVDIPDFLSSDLLAPTSEFEFNEVAYSSALLDPLKSKLLTDLTVGGYGIETLDEQALFERARDREVETALTRVSEAGRAVAVRGFPLPPGELSIHIDRAYQDMQGKVSGVSRDITLERAKLYVENRQFTIREVRELEQILIGFWNSVQERALNVARFTVELGIATYNTQLGRFRLRLDANKIKADVSIEQMRTEYERAKVYFDRFRTDIAAYEAQVRAQVETARARVDLYRAGIDGTRATNEVAISNSTLASRALEFDIQNFIEVNKLAVENARTKLLATVEAIKFRTAGVQFAGQQYFALLTAIESSINALAVQSKST